MSEKVKFTVRLSAYSNISYETTSEVEYDREEWDDMTIEQRQKAVDEAVRESIFEDIDGSVEFEDESDNPDSESVPPVVRRRKDA